MPESTSLLLLKGKSLLVQQRGPTSGRMPIREIHLFRHGSAEAEESTRQTFSVYKGTVQVVNQIGRSVVAQFESGLGLTSDSVGCHAGDVCQTAQARTIPAIRPAIGAKESRTQTCLRTTSSSKLPDRLKRLKRSRRIPLPSRSDDLEG